MYLVINGLVGDEPSHTLNTEPDAEHALAGTCGDEVNQYFKLKAVEIDPDHGAIFTLASGEGVESRYISGILLIVEEIDEDQ